MKDHILVAEELLLGLGSPRFGHTSCALFSELMAELRAKNTVLFTGGGSKSCARTSWSEEVLR
jgi:hypothetical protein